MERIILLSIQNLDELLTNQSVIKGAALIKPASQRYICPIDDCPWQGIDTVDLNGHVKIYHDSDVELENYKLQIVISEDELLELAVKGVAVIEGSTFQLFQPVQFFYSPEGGKWCFDSDVNIYKRGTKATAKEAELLKQLQDARSTIAEALTRKEDLNRVLEEANRPAHSQIEQPKREPAEARISLSSSQMFHDAVEVPVEDPESERSGVIAACGVLEGVNSKLETSAAALQTQLQSVSDVMGKGVLVWAEEHAKDIRNIENQRKQIEALRGELSQKNVLVSDSVSIHRRFLTCAREGMIDRVKTTYQRSPEVTAIVNKGNDVAHRANILAHITLYKGGKLSPDDIETFEKIYGLHPAKWHTSLISPRCVEMWNMMGTMAATRARIKFRTSSYSLLYQQFLALCEKTSSIRTLIEKEKGTEADAAKAFDEHSEVTSNLEKMKIIVDQFTQQDKLRRSSNDD